MRGFRSGGWVAPLYRLVLLVIGLAVGADRLAANPGWEIVDHWNQKQGLPQSMVYAVAHGPDGYVWTGTRGGVSRFDGVAFTTYDDRKDNQLTELETWTIHASADGTIWAGTFGRGVVRIKDGVFTHFTTAEGMTSNLITSITEDPEGGIWAATNGGGALTGVSRIKDGKVTAYTAANGEATPRIRELYCDPTGTLWFGTVTGDLGRFANGRFEIVHFDCPVQPKEECRGIVRDHNGDIWSATHSGIFRVREGKAKHYSVAEGLSGGRVFSIFIDREGTIWAGTEVGLDRYVAEEDRFKHEVSPDYPDPVLTISQDREGSLWIGFRSMGLARIYRGAFKSYSRADGMADESVSAVLSDRQGRIWIGAEKGLMKFENGRFTDLTRCPTLTTRGLGSLMEDRQGRLWVGTFDGPYHSTLSTADPHWLEKPEFVSCASPELPHAAIRALLEASDGTVWMATVNSGAFAYKDGHYTRYGKAEGMGDNATRGLAEDKEGNIWIGTRDGLTRIAHGVITIFRAEQGLASNAVTTLYRDSHDAIWIGTRYGVSRLRDGRFENFTVRHGLLMNHVYSFCEDSKGFLWMTCAKGVFRIPMAQFDEVAAGRRSMMDSLVFGREHGLASTAFPAGNFPSSSRGVDGKIWFGLLGGIAVVDPLDFRTNELPPPVHISDAVINDQIYPPKKPAVIPPGRGDVGFKYHALSYLAPEKMQFRHQLIGYDENWIDPGAVRAAHYSNLPPGDYTFRVKASNNDGVWNETGAAFNFTLQPHFYQTRWFLGLEIGLGLTLALGIGYGVYRWRVRQVRREAEALQRQNAELERRVAERTAALAKSNETLHASEYFYHSLVENLPQVIVRKDPHGVYTYANTAFAELVGRPLDTIVGRTDVDIYPPTDAAKARADDAKVLASRQTLESEQVVENAGRKRYFHVKHVPLYGADGQALGVQVLSWDVTVFRETEERLKKAQRELIETSRLAGMAEMATGVLHNIGNVLTSANTSADLAATHLREFHIPSLAKIANLLLEQKDNLLHFYATDPRAAKLPTFLDQLARHLETERSGLLNEIQSLKTNIEHMKEIVAAQQAFAGVAGLTEQLPPADIVNHALELSQVALARHGIDVERDFATTPPIVVNRQKAAQILINLFTNAKESLMECEPGKRRLRVAIAQTSGSNVQISVTDNGRGISAEHLTRIFGFGFTTKKSGHGFGLHSSALAAKELGGSLRAASPGPGLGATFTLELPVAAPTEAPAAETAPAEVLTN